MKNALIIGMMLWTSLSWSLDYESSTRNALFPTYSRLSNVHTKKKKNSLLEQSKILLIKRDYSVNKLGSAIEMLTNFVTTKENMTIFVEAVRNVLNASMFALIQKNKIDAMEAHKLFSIAIYESNGEVKFDAQAFETLYEYFDDLFDEKPILKGQLSNIVERINSASYSIECLSQARHGGRGNHHRMLDMFLEIQYLNSNKQQKAITPPRRYRLTERRKTGSILDEAITLTLEVDYSLAKIASVIESLYNAQSNEFALALQYLVNVAALELMRWQNLDPRQAHALFVNVMKGDEGSLLAFKAYLADSLFSEALGDLEKFMQLFERLNGKPHHINSYKPKYFGLLYHPSTEDYFLDYHVAITDQMPQENQNK